MGKINTTMETEKHLLFDIAEAEIDFSNDAWKDAVKNDFQEIQNSLEVKPEAQSPAYYTWFWFLIRYGRALSSPEGQAYMKRNNLNVFTLVKDVMGFTMASGGAYTIGYKFFDECLKNTTGVDVSGIKIHRSQTPRAESADNPLQQIYYGAPGTGKSHEINQKTEGENVIRTTFHPDSDYSTFVGAYKPTTKQVVLRDVSGHKIVENGEFVYEDRIVYEFVEQAFLQAYEQAWRNYAENSESPKKQYLVIEEINRGNCAQIFGDLFQLLDRNDSGFSDYPIKADKDMKKQLGKAFEGLSIANPDVINAQYKGRDVVTEVLSGDILLLPNNLYIWATMNTSDQSLFPIDSAFKRRWEWKYMPIAQGLDENGKELKWGIEVGSNVYNWWSFLDKINKQVYDLTHSEDKKLGFFFCKASDGIISVDTFVGKVIFYLWNDVFKDFDFDGAIFKDTDGSKLTYNKFYTNNLQGCSEVATDKVEQFLINLGVDILSATASDDPNEELDVDGNKASSTTKDFTKYALNGNGSFSKGMVMYEAMRAYVEQNPSMTAEEVTNTWLSLNVNMPNLVETAAMFDDRVSRSKDPRIKEKSKQVTLNNGEVIFISNQFDTTRIADLISKVNAQDWNITITKA